MSQEVMRIRLKSLTDIQRQMSRLYREVRTGVLSPGDLTSLSQHLSRLHSMMVSEREVDVSEELAAIEMQISDLSKRR